MPTPTDNSNARELTRMVASYADNADLTVRSKVGVTGIRWVAYLAGKSTMSLPVLCAVARVLGLSVGQLISKAEGRHRG